MFGNSRSSQLNFARVNVTVPKVHKTGQIERKKPGKADDPLKFFTATDVVAYDAQPEFSSALSADIAARGGRVMIFIHGYNTSFDSAVYRVTQIAHDFGYPGTPVLFSWASGGSTKDYVYDRESASVARDQLEVTLAAARAVRRPPHRHHRAFHGHMGDDGDAAPARDRAATAISAASSATWCWPRPTSMSTCSAARCAATASRRAPSS